MKPSKTTPQSIATAAVFLLVLTIPCAYAQDGQGFRLHGWQPVQSALVVRNTGSSPPQTLKPNASGLRADQRICLQPETAPQTLVQVQPIEGGEARFLVLGGQMPACQAVGAGWSVAASGAAPWYKTLFAMLDPQASGVRVSASSTGTTRGTNADPAAASSMQDPCGIYPSAQGTIYLPSGPTTLTLGTQLPEGSRVTLQSDSAGESMSATVTQGRLSWPSRLFQAAERWRLSLQPPGTSSSSSHVAHDCRASLTVQPTSANPLRAARQSTPPLAADPATQHATLVAVQLDDPGLAAWHAWLLSTLVEFGPAQATTPSALNSALWQGWWQANAPR